MAVGDITDRLCGKCYVETKFKSLAYGETNETDEHNDIWISNDWTLEVCLKCGVRRFQKRYWCSEDRDNDDNLIPTQAEFYAQSLRSWNPEVVSALPERLREFYIETYLAFESDSLTLAAAGVRAVVEGACVEKGIVGFSYVTTGGKPRIKKDLKGKIKELDRIGALETDEANALHQLRFLGNEAVHALDRPSRDELVAALEIVEHMLSELFLRPVRAAAAVRHASKIETARKARKSSKP